MRDKYFQKGFTLIEAMIAAALLSISLLGVVAMMVYFGTQTTDRTLRDCLLDKATSALMQFRTNNLPISATFTCANKTGTLTISPTTYPPDCNASPSTCCVDAAATAMGGGKTVVMRTRVCNFP